MKTQQIWKKYSSDLKHFILSKVKEPAIADDILQETFIKIHTKLHTLKDVKKLKPWCFSIARNMMLHYWRATKKLTEIDYPFEDTEEIETEHTERDCLYGIIKNLPKKYRTPLFLSDIKGLKQQEVATYLQQSLPTTKSQIQRARKLVAQGFIDCCGFTMQENGTLIGEVQEKEDCKVCS